MRRAAVVLSALTVLAGCTAPAEPQGPAPSPKPDRPPVIVDADAYGAVYFDPAGSRYVGARRDGTIAWTAPAGPADPIVAGCLTRCPDAVLSGSADALNAPGLPDPQPVLVVGGQRQPLTGLDEPKRWVLTATGTDDLIAHTGDGNGRWWLEIRGGGAATKVAVGGPRTTWREDVGSRHGLAISSTTARTGTGAGTGTRAEARWFDRDTAGWRATGPAIRVDGATACLNPSGSQALLIGQRPTLLDRTGALTPVTDLERAGTCALSGAGGIVADLSRGMRGTRSQVRVFDANGAVTRRNETATDVAVTADPGSRVAYVSGGTLLEIDPLTGALIRSLTGVRAARYDGAGALVVIRDDLSLAWTGQ